MAKRDRESRLYSRESSLVEVLEKENETLGSANKSKERIRKIIGSKIKVSAKNASQHNLINSIHKNEITICKGLAGSGKTFVALVQAINLILDTKTPYVQIYLVKSVTSLKGEDLGYLKGDLKEKFEPVIWSYTLNLEKMMTKSSIQSLINEGFITPCPLAFARGVTIDNSIIISDESQNITLDNMRTLMTRIGSDSKLIILGDENQIDLNKKKDSSLSVICDLFKNVDGIGVIEMDGNDENLRNPLIVAIESKFKNYFENGK